VGAKMVGFARKVEGLIFRKRKDVVCKAKDVFLAMSKLQDARSYVLSQRFSAKDILALGRQTISILNRDSAIIIVRR
jgi:hypothetical protein